MRMNIYDYKGKYVALFSFFQPIKKSNNISI